MGKSKCISCGAIFHIGDESVEFPCPACGESLGRCARCRTIGKKYTCTCGFGGP
ncbi:MAG: zinc finger domain-containing protein [Candidatus Hydrothermarchaeota archaeon]|nr:zinc finger domain-containing protein [Candidatus Hydrothermarchaeota archaeon]